MVKRLENRVLIVTGASSGIGEATAVEAGRAGMRVVLAARGVEGLERVAVRVREAGGGALVVPTDVGDPGQCRALVERACGELGGVDAMFANAGYGFFQRAGDWGAAVEEERMWRVNYFGAVECIRAALEKMTPGGHVLVCSSVAAQTGLPWKGSYSATKAALHGFATSLRVEVASRGIEVTTVYPVGTKTGFSRTAEALGGAGVPRDETPSWLEQSAEHVARRVVASLRRPRPEVWPSRVGQVASAVWVMFPRLRGWCMRRQFQEPNGS